MSDTASAKVQQTADSSSSEQQVKTGSPNDFLKSVIGKKVIVRLNSGIDYHGTLSCLDGYMNIAMEDTEEFVDGALKSAYGDAFIRGNNGAHIFCL
ncbi:U4/U6-U5 snRNP complex subunit lsm6 [Malassezia arunalokei]|uniref:U6 snRNA-associated Sm-like protein LSm6 n=1 Tax=Malassezia arunalokei TaxID=1514897 RepID=A0AAJ6CLD4_9BASI|nr:U4/U6-U5 snRNP complex subunit lsm6 [Malassezia arunalokei]